MSSRKKIADYFGITVEELMGTKKEPAGMGELDKQMQEIVALLNSATRWKRCCAPGQSRIARISSFVIMPKRSFLLYL